MFRLAVILVSVIFVSAGNHGREFQGKIVGGVEINISKVPYMACILSENKQFCGGAILNTRFILTAAHCTYDEVAEDLQVRVGSSRARRGGQLVQVNRIIEHPNYDNSSIDFDVALLELEEDLVMGKPIKMAEELPEPDTFCSVAGWGHTSYNGSPSATLLTVDVPMISEDDCNDAYASEITENMFCAGHFGGGMDACQGDSGGPLVCNGKVAGIVSWGDGCGAPGDFTVYTNLPLFREWVLENSKL